VYHQKAKQEENHNPGPKDPLILFRAPLDHPYRIPAHPQGVSNTIQPLLGALEHIPLMAQITEDGASAIEKLVELGIRRGEEALFAQRVVLPVVGRCAAAEGEACVCVGVGWGEGALACGGGGCVRVGIFGRGGVVRSAAEQLASVGGVDGAFPVFFEFVELCPVGGQVRAEVF
jgi:hypothetical protein